MTYLDHWNEGFEASENYWRQKEREELAAHVEGMIVPENGYENRPFFGTAAARDWARRENEVLYRVLAHLRQSEKYADGCTPANNAGKGHTFLLGCEKRAKLGDMPQSHSDAPQSTYETMSRHADGTARKLYDNVDAPQGCCERCSGAATIDYCTNARCLCHTPQETEWEARRQAGEVPFQAPHGCCEECIGKAILEAWFGQSFACLNPNCPNCHKKAPQGDSDEGV